MSLHVEAQQFISDDSDNTLLDLSVDISVVLSVLY